MAYEIQELSEGALAIASAAELSNLRNNLDSDAYLTSDIDLSATAMAADEWTAQTFYRQWIVIKVAAESKIYRCLIDHTSGSSFAADLAAGKWEYVRDFVPNYSSSSTYSIGAEVVYNNNIYQCITAVSTPEEFDIDKWMQIGSMDTGWLAIGTFRNDFTGSIDGKGHIIKNMFCKSTIIVESSLFGAFDGSGVKNLSLLGFCVIGSYLGGSAACLINNTTSAANLKNIHVVKSYIKSDWHAGGITGTGSQTIFIDCSVNVILETKEDKATLGALCGNGSLDRSGSRNILVSGRIIGAGSNLASGIGSLSYVQKIKNAIINISFEGTFLAIAGIVVVESADNAIENVINISTKPGTATLVYGIAQASEQVVNCYFLDTFGGADVEHQKTAAELKQRETFAGWNFKRDWYMAADDNWIEKLFPPNDGYPCLRTLWKIGTEIIGRKIRYGLLGPIRGLLG